MGRGGLWSRRAALVGEPPDPRVPWVPKDADSKDSVIEFRGYEAFFEPLLGWSARLHDELRAITRPKYLRWASRFEAVPIALNVRCAGDFPPAPPGAARLRFGEATPVSWFVRALRLVREAAGRTEEAYVVSDGSAPRLRELLAEPRVVLVRPGCAISDLLVLARAGPPGLRLQQLQRMGRLSRRDARRRPPGTTAHRLADAVTGKRFVASRIGYVHTRFRVLGRRCTLLVAIGMKTAARMCDA